jgi:predicted transcriptional regulator
MGLKKDYLQPDNLVFLSNVFSVLSSGARLNIIAYLLAQGQSNNKQLVEHLGLCQSAVSGHVKKLQSVRIVLADAMENQNIYRINQPLWEEIKFAARSFGEGDDFFSEDDKDDHIE